MDADHSGDADQSAPGVPEQTVLGMPKVDRLVLFIGVPALAAVVGLVLPPVARWALDWHRGLPFRFLFRLLGAVDQPWELVANLAVWVALGLAIGFVALAETTTVTLTAARVNLRKDGDDHVFARTYVAAVFRDGKQLVVTDHESRELFRGDSEQPEAALAEAFRMYGYPWSDRSPRSDPESGQ